MSAITRLRSALSLATIVAYGLIALCAFGQTVPWTEIDTPHTVSRLHFYTPLDGWATGYETTERFLMRSSDGGFSWRVAERWDSTAPWDENRDYGLYERAEFRNPMEGAAAGSNFAWRRDARVRGHFPGQDNGILSAVRFYVTSDGGNSWSLRRGRITETVYFGEEDMAREANRKYFMYAIFPSSRIGVMAGHIAWNSPGYDGAAYRGYVIASTQDGGDTWQQFLFGEFPRACDTGFGPKEVGRIEFVEGQYAWIPTPVNYCCPPRKHLFRTQDGGRSWNALTYNFLPFQGFDLDLDFVSPTHGFDRRRGTETHDAGNTWHENQDFEGGPPVFLSASEGWAIGRPRNTEAQQYGIYHTTDGGLTWSIERPPPNPRGLRWDSATQTLWARGFYGGFGLLRRGRPPTTIRAAGKSALMWGELKRIQGD